VQKAAENKRFGLGDVNADLIADLEVSWEGHINQCDEGAKGCSFDGSFVSI
jgi:hypothetical protein